MKLLDPTRDHEVIASPTKGPAYESDVRGAVAKQKSGRGARQGDDCTAIGTGITRDVEMAALKRELAIVRAERDLLREVATFFAKELS